MAKKIIRITINQCERCNYEWQPRQEGEIKCCPRCHSPYWYIPREKRRCRIKGVLIDAKKNKYKCPSCHRTWDTIKKGGFNPYGSLRCPYGCKKVFRTKVIIKKKKT